MHDRSNQNTTTHPRRGGSRRRRIDEQNESDSTTRRRAPHASWANATDNNTNNNEEHGSRYNSNGRIVTTIGNTNIVPGRGARMYNGNIDRTDIFFRRLHNPDSITYEAGFCYLLFFEPRQQAAARTVLGPSPTIMSIRNYARAHSIVLNSFLGDWNKWGDLIHIRIPGTDLVDLSRFEMIYNHMTRIGAEKPYYLASVSLPPVVDWINGLYRRLTIALFVFSFVLFLLMLTNPTIYLATTRLLEVIKYVLLVLLDFDVEIIFFRTWSLGSLLSIYFMSLILVLLYDIVSSFIIMTVLSIFRWRSGNLSRSRSTIFDCTSPYTSTGIDWLNATSKNIYAFLRPIQYPATYPPETETLDSLSMDDLTIYENVVTFNMIGRQHDAGIKFRIDGLSDKSKQSNVGDADIELLWEDFIQDPDREERIKNLLASIRIFDRSYDYVMTDLLPDIKILVSSSLTVRELTFLTTQYPGRTILNTLDDNDPECYLNSFYKVVKRLIAERISSNKVVLNLGNDCWDWPIDGYSHCISSPDPSHSSERLRCYTYANEMEAQSIAIPLLDMPLCAVNYAFNILCVTNLAYNFDIEYLVAHAYRLNCETVYATLLGNSSMLTDSDGLLSTQEIRFRRFKDLTGKELLVLTNCRTGVERVYNFKIVLRHWLVTAIRIDAETVYVRNTIMDNRNMVTFQYTKMNDRNTPIPRTVTIQNKEAEHCMWFAITPDTYMTTPFLNQEYSLFVVPKHFYVHYSATVARGERSTASMFTSSILSLSGTYEDLVAIPYFDKYLTRFSNSPEFLKTLIKTAKLEKQLANADETLEIPRLTMWERVENFFSFTTRSNFSNKMNLDRLRGYFKDSVNMLAIQIEISEDLRGRNEVIVDTGIRRAEEIVLRPPESRRGLNNDSVRQNAYSFNNARENAASINRNEELGDAINDAEEGLRLLRRVDDLRLTIDIEGFDPEDVFLPNEVNILERGLGIRHHYRRRNDGRARRWINDMAIDARDNLLPARAGDRYDSHNQVDENTGLDLEGRRNYGALVNGRNRFSNSRVMNNSLGRNTNVRRADVSQVNNKRTNRTTDTSIIYNTLSGTLCEALFICPSKVKTLTSHIIGNVGVCNLLFKNTVAVLIYKNCVCTFGNNTTDRKTPVLELSDTRFTRIDHTFETNLDYLLSRQLVILECIDIQKFLIIAESEPRSSKKNLCLYRELVPETSGIFSAGHNYCDPRTSIAICEHLNVILVTEETIFVPQKLSPTNVDIVLYIQNNHTYRLNKDKFMSFVARWSVSCMHLFDIFLNGPVPESIIRRRNILTRLETSLKICSNYRLCSIYNVIAYNIELERILLSKFELIHEKDNIYYDRCLLHFDMYDVQSNSFLTGRPSQIYTYAWDGEDFVTVTFDSLRNIYRAERPCRYLIMSETISFMRERRIVDFCIKNIKALEEYDWDGIRIHLEDGVPGCGKTYKVCKFHNKSCDLVLTATKAGNMEYLQKFPLNPARYRTYDSVLLNGCPVCNTMWADEGLMEHSGILLLVAFISKASKMHVLGDRRQIPWINRIVGFSTKNSVLNFDTIDTIRETRRLPQSMMPILNKFYKGITSLNPSRGSISINRIRGLPEVVPTGKIFTFTQFEKSLLKKRFRDRSINTIHEVQGATVEHAVLIRLIVQKNSIYDSIPHIIVGISRHTESITYLTVDTSDALSSVLENRITTEQSELRLESIVSKIPVTELPLCSAPTMIRREILVIEKTVTSRTYDWIRSILTPDNSVKPREIITTWKPLDNLTTDRALHYDVSEIQLLMDNMYEPVNEFKQSVLEGENPYPLEPEIVVNPAKAANCEPRRTEYLNNVLKTPQPKPSTKTFSETVRCIRARVLSPPLLQKDIDASDLSDKVFEVWKDTYIDEVRFGEAKINHLIDSDVYTTEWFSTRDSMQIKAMDGLELLERSAKKYNSHIKPNYKPILDNTHNTALPGGQVLTAHSILVTAKLSGRMRWFTAILKASLKEKFLITDGYSNTEINGHINRYLFGVKNAKILEADFSKFDKSQEEVMLLVVLKIMRFLGMDEETISIWEQSHMINYLSFHEQGIKIKTKFQRRSGDLLTLMGNVIVAMATLAYTHNLKNCFCAYFMGDDDLVYLPIETEIFDASEIISGLFNLTAKIEIYPEAPYFASKFVVYVHGVWYFVPDPVKAVVRLGRSDMYCKEHVELYYISFCDNMALYKCQAVRQETARIATIRYKNKFFRNVMDLSPLTEFIGSLLHNKSDFMKLFSGTRNIWERKLPVNLKKEFSQKVWELEMSGEF